MAEHRRSQIWILRSFDVITVIVGVVSLFLIWTSVNNYILTTKSVAAVRYVDATIQCEAGSYLVDFTVENHGPQDLEISRVTVTVLRDRLTTARLDETLQFREAFARGDSLSLAYTVPPAARDCELDETIEVAITVYLAMSSRRHPAVFSTTFRWEEIS